MGLTWQARPATNPLYPPTAIPAARRGACCRRSPWGSAFSATWARSRGSRPRWGARGARRGDEPIESLKAGALREGEAPQVVLASDLVDLRRRHRPGERDLPTAEPFVDRDAELAALRDWLPPPPPPPPPPPVPGGRGGAPAGPGA